MWFVYYSVWCYVACGFTTYVFARNFPYDGGMPRKAAIVALLSPVWPVALVLLIVWGLWWLVSHIPSVFTAGTAEFRVLFKAAMNKKVDN